jgi:hypothetical protein
MGIVRHKENAMPRKVKLFAAGLLLAVVGVCCAFLFSASAHAEDEDNWEPGDPYPPIAGNGWSIDADGVMRVENDAGWKDYLANGPGDWIWEYDDGILDERVQKLVIGKDVTTLSIYDPTHYNDDSMVEDVAQQLAYNAGIYKPYVSVAMQDPKCMPPVIEVEKGNRIFTVQDGLLINNVKKSVVLSEIDVSDVIIPKGIQSIEAWAFYYRDIKSVTFPTSLKVIGAAAFSRCGELTSVTLPNSLVKLETCAFSGCSSLSDVTLSSNLKTIEGMAFSSCPIEEITIPNGVEKIDFWVFCGCDALKKVHLPNTIQRIESYAFSGCDQLEGINWPSSLNYIGYRAFENCTSWRVIILPDTLNRIGEEAFLGCEPILLQLPPKLTVEIVPPEERGWSMNLKDEESTQLLGIDYAESLIVTGTDYSLGPYAVKVADQVVFLGEPPASWHPFVETVYSKNVYYLDQYASSWDSVDAIAWSGVLMEQWTKEQVQELFDTSEALAIEGHIPSAPDIPVPVEVHDGNGWSYTADGVLTVNTNEGWQEWLRKEDLSNVGTLILTKDVTDVSFDGLNFSPQRIYVDSQNPVYYYGGGMMVNLKTMQIMACDMTAMSNIVLPEGIRSIGDGAYKGRYYIDSIQFPSTLESIGDEAFSGCSELRSIVIPDSVTQIGQYAFKDCTSLQTIKLPINLQSIAIGTFSNCGLTALNLPGEITEIGEKAFFGCTNLWEVVLPAKLKTLGRSAFEYCTELNYIWFPDQLERIESFTFGNCVALANAILPDSLLEIGDQAFHDCKLTMLRIPPKLSVIDFNTTTNKEPFDPNLMNNKILGLKSVDFLYFSGCDYEFSESTFQNVRNVYFQKQPPKNIGSFIDELTVGDIFCTNTYHLAWRSADVAKWVKDKLQTMPAREMNAVVKREVSATPRPITPPIVSEDMNTTQGSNASKAPDSDKSPAKGNTVDPVMIAMAVLILVAIAAVVILAIQSKAKMRKKRRKRASAPQLPFGKEADQAVPTTSPAKTQESSSSETQETIPDETQETK